LMSARRRL